MTPELAAFALADPRQARTSREGPSGGNAGQRPPLPTGGRFTPPQGQALPSVRNSNANQKLTHQSASGETVHVALIELSCEISVLRSVLTGTVPPPLPDRAATRQILTVRRSA